MAGGALAAGGEDEKRAEHTGYPPPGQDDALAGLLPLAAELGLSLGDERPDPRKCVLALLPVCHACNVFPSNLSVTCNMCVPAQQRARTWMIDPDD